MRYVALAVDYDGTIAHDGVVAHTTQEALTRIAPSGRKLLLVTGRDLDDLFITFPEFKMFERIVAENGALLYDPATKAIRNLAPAPPEALVKELRRRGIPVSVGRSIVATVEPHEAAVLEVIKDLGLEWHVIFNKGSVMVLPSAVTKATGLAAALEELNIAPQQVIGVGDAENDHAFLRYCGLGVAVADALPALKNAADWVTDGSRGDGVIEVVNRLLADDLADIEPRVANHTPGDL